jgi:hypothetical protein
LLGSKTILSFARERIEPPKFLILFLRSISTVAIIPLWFFMYETIASSTELPEILIFLKSFIVLIATEAEVFF